MSKQKTKRSAKPVKGGRADKVLLRGWWHGLSGPGRRRLLLACVHVLILGGIGSGVWFGLRVADKYVQQMGRFKGPIKLVLRIKNPKNEALVTTREIKDAGLPANAAVVAKDSDSAGGVVVEQAGRSVRLAADDVQPSWLARFQYVRDNLQKHAESIANQPVAGRAGPDWFDAAMAGRIREAAAADPFVERVVQVDKQPVAQDSGPQHFARQVVLTVVLRKPVAHIFVGPRGYLLDAKGVVLERRDNLIGLPQVADFAANPKWKDGLAPGQAVDAPDIQAGLDLLVKLSSQPFFSEIAEVNVDNFRMTRPRNSQLVLKTHPAGGLGQQAIGWGALPERDFERNNSQERIQILNDIWVEYKKLNLMDREQSIYTLWQVPHKAFWPKSNTGTAGFGPPAPPGPHSGPVASQ